MFVYFHLHYTSCTSGDKGGALEAAAKAVNVATGKEELEMANAALEGALDGFPQPDTTGMGTKQTTISEESAVVPHGHSVHEDESPPEVRTLRLEQEVLNLKLQLLEQRVRGGIPLQFEEDYNHHWEEAYASGSRRERRPSAHVPAPASHSNSALYGTEQGETVETLESSEPVGEPDSPVVDGDSNDEELPYASPGTMTVKEIEADEELELENTSSKEEQAADTQADTSASTKFAEDLRAGDAPKDDHSETDAEDLVLAAKTDNVAIDEARPKEGYGSGDDEGLEISEEQAIEEPDYTSVEMEAEPAVVAKESAPQDAEASSDGKKESRTGNAVEEENEQPPPEPELVLPELYDSPRAPPEDVP